jgi:hypothetical protein
VGVNGAPIVLPFHLRGRGSSPLAMFEKIRVWHDDARQGISHAMQLLRNKLEGHLYAFGSMAEVGLSARTRERGTARTLAGSARSCQTTIHDRLT